MWDEYAKSIDFNPRSREGSDISDHRILLLAYNFNPRSREGSDLDFVCVLGYVQLISIHAPAKGATTISEYTTAWRKAISIHAPAKGATDPAGSRSRAYSISIHAPAKGATVVPTVVHY
mgnify:CR=1 FL=1